MTTHFLPSPRALLRRCALCGLAAALAACSTTPRLDQQFGARTRQDQVLQTLNPQAGQNQALVTGLDEETAKAVRKNYVESYSAPKPYTSSLSTGTTSTASH